MKVQNIIIFIYFILLLMLNHISCIMVASEDDGELTYINRINLNIKPDDFIELIENPTSSEKKKCSFTGYFSDDTCDLTGNICIHGGISKPFPKKSFRISFKGELSSDNIFTKFSPVINRGNSFSQLVLNANAIDFSNIRNFLSMYISNRLGILAPRIDFAEVYINGSYYGLYSIIENINDDLIFKILGHNNFDLLKSDNQNGNFKTKNVFEGDPYVPPDEGFELKHGTTVKLKEFVCWLESDSSTVEELEKVISKESISKYFWGSYYTSDFDALSKNFFFFYNKHCDTFSIIPWDADATFGRKWNGEKKESVFFDIYVIRNGICEYLIKKDNWKEQLLIEYQEIKSIFSPDSLHILLNSIQEELSSVVYRDMCLWNNTLLNYFKNEKCWNFWDDISNDPSKMWHDEIEIIRDFIARRELEILNDLGGINN